MHSATFRSMKPLHVGKFVPPPYAGVEAHVDTLLRSFGPEVKATLVAGQVAQARATHDFPYRVLTAKSFGKLASTTMSPGVLHHVAAELRNKRCNLLHIHSPNPWGEIAAITCAKDAPVVMTWHSDIVRQRQLLRLYRGVQKRALMRADRILVFTPKHYESSEQLRDLNLEAKIVNVPIGIDFSRLNDRNGGHGTSCKIRDFAAGRPILLTVGRHVYYKGYEYLLSAMSKVQTDTVLIVIGTGVLSEKLRQQAVELGLSDRVLFLGEVDDASLVAALHICDLFCLPSIERSEAFGIATAEAMACGKPSIVCELGNGVNYLNQSDKTGLTVPPRDVNRLADAIDVLVRDDVLRTRMGKFAREWVRTKFSIQAMRDGTVDVYRQLL